jgi:hypothetical protein
MQGFTHPRQLVMGRATRFCMVAPNTFSVIIAVLSLIYKNVFQVHMHDRKCQITVSATGHSRIVGSWYGASFMLHFLHLEFGGGCYIFGKFVDPCQNVYIYIWCTTSFKGYCQHSLMMVQSSPTLLL